MLNILGKRPDGYHELETLFHHVMVCDKLSVDTSGGEFTFSCDDDSIPTDSGNLVYKAAMLFFEKTGIRPQGKIHLSKKLPSQAGLGGGSANAATILRALNFQFGKPLENQQLYTIAASLGADVAFFLDDLPAIGTGLGERLELLSPFKALEESWVVLVKPDFGISTPWAYKALADFPEHRNGTKDRVRNFVKVLQNHTLSDAAPCFFNSLEAPVFKEYPILQEYQNFLTENGASVALMSGSGSTTFALIEGQREAETLLEKFMEKFTGIQWTAIAKL